MDIYDEAVAYLTEFPERILAAWERPEVEDGGALFLYCSPSGTGRDHSVQQGRAKKGWIYGCLTQVRTGDYEAWTPELTAAIRADARIPLSPHDITVDSLPAFAEWQRAMKAMREAEVQ